MALVYNWRRGQSGQSALRVDVPKVRWKSKHTRCAQGLAAPRGAQAECTQGALAKRAQGAPGNKRSSALGTTGAQG